MTDDKTDAEILAELRKEFSTMMRSEITLEDEFKEKLKNMKISRRAVEKKIVAQKKKMGIVEDYKF